MSQQPIPFTQILSRVGPDVIRREWKITEAGVGTDRWHVQHNGTTIAYNLSRKDAEYIVWLHNECAPVLCRSFEQAVEHNAQLQSNLQQLNVQILAGQLVGVFSENGNGAGRYN